MRIGNRDFQTSGHTYVMGILNVTPDSFSDGGRWNHMDDALFHAQRMIEEGADILDIGGESTRPGGYTRISDEEEISRVAPVIEALKKRFDTPLSVDTYKSGVASAAIAAGADLINDIWGLKADKKMAEVIAKAKLPSCLMHNRETTPTRLFPPSRGGRTIGDQVSRTASENSQINQRWEYSSSPLSAFASRNSGSKTIVLFSSSISPLCLGIPNFSGKSVWIRAITFIAISSATFLTPFLSCIFSSISHGSESLPYVLS